MSEEAMTPEKLKEMAKLVFLSNRISEFHAKNLKNYALIFFDGVKKAEIKYDLSHRPSDDGPKEAPKNNDEFYKEIGKAAMNMKSESFVAYYLEVEDGVEQTHAVKRFEAIEAAVRHLFWNDVIVKVYFNGQIAYESKT